MASVSIITVLTCSCSLQAMQLMDQVGSGVNILITALHPLATKLLVVEHVHGCLVPPQTFQIKLDRI